MNKIKQLALISISIGLTLAMNSLVLAPCFAAEQDNQVVVAVLGSQPGKCTDPEQSIKKAIELLIKQQVKQLDIKKHIPNKQDNPIGELKLRDKNRVLFLGGPEVVPM